jgi:hypothetical protein
VCIPSNRLDLKPMSKRKNFIADLPGVTIVDKMITFDGTRGELEDAILAMSNKIIDQEKELEDSQTLVNAMIEGRKGKVH